MRNERGFTLIEMLIALGIGSLLMISVFNVFASQQRALVQDQGMSDLTQNARIILEIISKNILKAGYDPRQINFTPVDPESDKGRLRIYADLDEDGKIDKDKGEDILYVFDSKNGQIKKNNKPMADNILNLEFRYDFPPPEATNIQVTLIARTDKEYPNYTNGFNLTGNLQDGTCPTITLINQINLRNGG